METADRSSPLTRRVFLAASGLTGLTTAALAGLEPALRARLGAAPAGTATANPFTLGVASGDPDHRSVVLWTRLAPEPLDPATPGDTPVPVQWEVYADERLRRPVARGVTQARPETAHTVHVEVGALLPDRWYWYRFRTGAHISPVGRTRTFPVPAGGARRPPALRPGVVPAP